MGGVRKKGPTWFGRWTDATGRRIERQLPAKSKGEAEYPGAVLERAALSESLGLSDGQVDVTFAELWRRFKPIARRKASWRMLESRFRLHLLPELGETQLRRIRPADVERFLAGRAGKGLSPRTCEHLRMHGQVLFNFAIKRERCFKGDNPFAQAERPRVPERPILYLQAHHVQPVIEAVPADWRSFFMLCVYTGLRSGELRALTRKSIDLNHGGLVITRTGTRKTTKTGKNRFVPLPTAALPYLRAALKASEGRPWLFVDGWGKQLTKDIRPSDILREALKQAGVHDEYEGLRFHDLRKTFLTHFYELTGDLTATARIGGHSEEVAAGIYVARNSKRLAAMAEGMTYENVSPPQPRLALQVGETGSSDDVTSNNETQLNAGDNK